MDAADSGPEQVYRKHLEDGRFMIQRCKKCASHVFYPRLLCTSCGAAELEFQPASGRGTVYSTTVVRRKAEQGGDYNVAIIELAEGPRLMSRVIDIPAAGVAIGMPVQVAIEQAKDGPLVVFRPAQ